MKNNLTNIIRGKGYRITPLLKVLLDIFSKSDAHLSVSDLIPVLKKEALSPNKTTLYRQLEQLTQIGILQENIFPDMVKHYCFKHGHHHHFICKQCGFIKAVAIENCGKMTKKLANKLKKEGHMLNEHIMTFAGVCSNCLTT